MSSSPARSRETYKLHPVGVPGEAHISRSRVPGVAVVIEGIDLGLGLALAAINGPGIAEAELDEGARVELHLAPGVSLHGHELAVDARDGAQRAVTDAFVPVVAVELEPLAGADRELAFDGIHLKLVFDLAARKADVVDGAVDPVHLGVGAGIDEAVEVRLLAAVLVPIRQEPIPAFVDLRRPVDMAAFGVGAQAVAHPAVGESLGRGALPLCLLTADLRDDDAAVALLQLGEEAAALDATLLPVISCEDHLRALLRRLAHDARIDVRVEHRRFLDDHHVSRPQLGTRELPPRSWNQTSRWAVLAWANPARLISSAMAFIGPRPTTRHPARSCASRMALRP